ncbi:MAG: 3-oxoacyl-ACP synthase III [Oligoflexales bacterium]
MRYRNVCIESTGHFLPEQELTSEEIETRLKPLWDRYSLQTGYLELLTGIRSRRVWPVGTKPSSVASQAGRKSLVKAGVAPEEVDLVMHTGVCRDASEPSTANVVHHELNLPPHCMAFDLSNACLGFLNGLTVAANMIELGQIKTALVVSGENSAPIYEVTIKALLENQEGANIRESMASLTLGSGAVAFVLQHKDISRSQHYLLGGVSQTDNDAYDLCEGHGDCYHQTMVTNTSGLMKSGLALSQVTWEYFKQHLGWDNSTPDYIFNHQVSRSHQSKVFNLLGLDERKAFFDMQTLGNTGTVATPLSLSLQEEKGTFKSGDLLALLGIGSGLNCMMLGVQW